MCLAPFSLISRSALWFSGCCRGDLLYHVSRGVYNAGTSALRRFPAVVQYDHADEANGGLSRRISGMEIARPAASSSSCNTIALHYEWPPSSMPSHRPTTESATAGSQLHCALPGSR